MLGKKLLLAALAAIAFIGVFAVAQEPGEPGKPNPSNSPSRELEDSRLVSVGRPCMADQVTVGTFWAFANGKGSTYEEAADNCKQSLVYYVYLLGDAECKKYMKIDSMNPDGTAPGFDDNSLPQGEPCRAYRSNMDPTKDIKYDYKDQDKQTGEWSVGCTLKSEVKYTCN